MLILLMRLLAVLPLSILHGLGICTGWLLYGVSSSYRRSLLENLQTAGYCKKRWGAISENGKSIFELPFIWFASDAKIQAMCTVHHWEYIVDALEQDHGLILLTPHLGAFELCARVIAQKIPLTALYRPPRKKILENLLKRARAHENLHMVPADLTGVRILMRTLKQHKAIGLLPDQVPRQGEGVWAPFFGKKAYTMTLPVRLAEVSHAPIVLAYAKRMPKARGYQIHFLPYEQVKNGSIIEQVTGLNKAMETLIDQCPEQYLWSYRRYKKV